MKNLPENARNRSSFRLDSRCRYQGFTLLELVVVIVIVSTLMATMLVRVMPAMDDAETASVLKLEGQLRSSLALASAAYVAAGEYARIEAMEGMNPMSLMLDTPSTYLGERMSGEEVPPEHWYFDEDTGELVYRPGSPRSVKYRGRPVEDVAFAVQLAWLESGAGAERGRRKDFYGVRLVRTGGEAWLEYEGDTSQ